MPKILVVEDNEINRELIVRRLERKGFQVVVAVDGQAGLEVTRAEAPDLVLMDMSLPVMDGWEATRRLKSAPETRHIPVIAVTAHAMAEDRAKAMAAGCDDYAAKPIDMRQLLDAIAVLLRRSPE